MNLTHLSSQPNAELPPDLYCSYLIRFWRSHPQGELRVSLQNIQTGESKPFANLENLFTYLKAQNRTLTVSSEPDSTQGH